VKNVMAWVKANLTIVICVAVILLVLPASWFVSTSWGQSIRKKQEKSANDELSKVKAATVDYKLPSFDPSTSEVSLKAAPSADLTDWFKKQRDHLTEAATAAYKRAEEFNRGRGADAQQLGRTPHAVLVEGLFPKAESKDAESAKLYEMEDKLLGKRDNPNPYQAMLDSIKAGDRADMVAIATRVSETDRDERLKITAGRRDMTPEEMQTLQATLVDQRLAAVQSRAKEISLFATLDNLPTGASGIPRDKIDAAKANVNDFFQYQWDLWTISDVLSAIRVANTDNGQLLTLERGTVKRLERMTLHPINSMGSDPSSGDIPSGPPTGDTKPGLVPTDMRRAISGRAGGSWNTFYDVRDVDIQVVVSSARLGQFIDAIERTNFMSVIDLDATNVDVWEDLRQGFYYGPEHVVRATIRIETVWLRSWTEPLMPEQFKAKITGQAVEGGMPAMPSPDASPAGPRRPRGKG